MKLIFEGIFFITLLYSCSAGSAEKTFEKSKPKNFKQNFSVTIPEIEGAQEYDNLKEYDYVFETKYFSIDKLYEKNENNVKNKLKSVLIFCDTSSYSAVIEKIFRELPPSGYELDFATYTNGLPSIISMDLFITSDSKPFCTPRPNIFQVNINKDLRILIEAEFIFEYAELDTLGYYYNNFYSEDYYDPWYMPGQVFKDSNDLNNFINSFNVYSDKSRSDSIYYTKLKSLFYENKEITTYRKNSLVIDPNYNSKINIQYVFKMVSFFRKLEKERLRKLYPNKSDSELHIISKLLSPPIMYHGSLWNREAFLYPMPSAVK
jgi:hypothetical protein